MNEYKYVRPDGWYGWVFASTYQKACEIISDYMDEGEFVVVVPTGRVIF